MGGSPDHALSFGAHGDWYRLSSPTYNATDWRSGDAGSLYSTAQGSTQTRALWLQDVWQFAPRLKATVGARYEDWRADDGYNLATSSNGGQFAVTQPTLTKSAISRKAHWRGQRPICGR